MAVPKGQRFGGRKAGTPNKLTGQIKDAIHKAFVEVGGASYLAKVANENPAVFCALLGRVLPTEIEASIEHNYIVRAPQQMVTPSEWKQQHAPSLPN